MNKKKKFPYIYIYIYIWILILISYEFNTKTFSRYSLGRVILCYLKLQTYLFILTPCWPELRVLLSLFIYSFFKTPGKFLTPPLTSVFFFSQEFPQISRILLSVLADFSSGMVWMVSILLQFTSLFFRILGTVPRAPNIICILVTLVFHNFCCPGICSVLRFLLSLLLLICLLMPFFILLLLPLSYIITIIDVGLYIFERHELPVNLLFLSLLLTKHQILPGLNRQCV